MPHIGDGIYSQMTTTQSDRVASVAIEWVNPMHADVFVLSQSGWQLLGHRQGSSSLGGPVLECASRSCSWKFGLGSVSSAFPRILKAI